MRVGVLGLGKMGKLHFLNALRMRSLKVCAVADRSRKKLQEAKQLCHHTKVYDDYRRLMDSEKLDAVIISLPNFLKEESIEYAAEKNLDILVDKPLSRSFLEAERIASRLRTKNSRLMVGANYRYIDSVQKVKKIFDDGRIGEAVIATLDLIMNGPFSHPLLPTPVPEWWFDKQKAGGGAVLDLGYHLIDICNWMFGNLELEYSTLENKLNLPIEDQATIVLKSKKGNTRCVINIGWFSKIVFPHFNFRVNLHGTNGFVSTEHFSPRNLHFHAVKKAVSNFAKRIAGRKIELLAYTYYYSSFAKTLEQFFESIRKGTEFPVTLEEQLEVMRIIQKIYESKRRS